MGSEKRDVGSEIHTRDAGGPRRWDRRLLLIAVNAVLIAAIVTGGFVLGLLDLSALLVCLVFIAVLTVAWAIGVNRTRRPREPR
jgi:hypothetical protein